MHLSLFTYNGRKVWIEFVFPPIPTRQFDFCAYLDGDEESGPHGYGSSLYIALCSLIQELWEAGE